MINCAYNSKVAMENQRPDIARIWEICEHLARETTPTNNDFRCNLPTRVTHSSFRCGKKHHPFLIQGKRHVIASKILNQIILGLVNGTVIDFQTAAMIICTFTPNGKKLNKPR